MIRINKGENPKRIVLWVWRVRPKILHIIRVYILIFNIYIKLSLILKESSATDDMDFNAIIYAIKDYNNITEVSLPWFRIVSHHVRHRKVNSNHLKGDFLICETNRHIVH